MKQFEARAVVKDMEEYTMQGSRPHIAIEISGLTNAQMGALVSALPAGGLDGLSHAGLVINARGANLIARFTSTDAAQKFTTAYGHCINEPVMAARQCVDKACKAYLAETAPAVAL